jgi:hypothetical protein
LTKNNFEKKKQQREKKCLIFFFFVFDSKNKSNKFQTPQQSERVIDARLSMKNLKALERVKKQNKPTTKPSKQLPRRHKQIKKRKDRRRRRKNNVFLSCNIMRNMTNHDTQPLSTSV